MTQLMIVDQAGGKSSEASASASTPGGSAALGAFASPSTSGGHGSTQHSHVEQKDYEAAFAKMSSQLGFGGAVPTLPPKAPPKKKKQDKKRKHADVAGGSPSQK